MSIITTPPKLVGDTVTVEFDFTSRLASGETITSAVVTAEVFSGEDANPSAILSGTDSVSGAVVSQLVTAGTVGVVYLLNAQIVSSASQNLTIQTYLAVLSSHPF